MENLQIEAAVKAATVLSGGQDVFWEEHVLHDMRLFAMARGETEEMVDHGVRNLTCANTALYPGETADFAVGDLPLSPASRWVGQSCASEPVALPGSPLRAPN